MTNEERVLDLVLEKTREGRIAWSYRPVPSFQGFGTMPGVPREDVYAAIIKTDTGELLAILRAGEARPRALTGTTRAILDGGGPGGRHGFAQSLSVRNRTKDTEILVEADAHTSARLQSLLRMVQDACSSENIVEELEKV